MYAQLSSQSQGLTTFSVFQAITRTQTKRSARKASPIPSTILRCRAIQPPSAMTPRFNRRSSARSTITGGMMRVVQAADNSWKVAWSTMDIINGFANGTRLTVVSKRPPRGNIYDHNGQLMVEQDGEVVELYAQAQHHPRRGALHRSALGDFAPEARRPDRAARYVTRRKRSSRSAMSIPTFSPRARANWRTPAKFSPTRAPRAATSGMASPPT